MNLRWLYLTLAGLCSAAGLALAAGHLPPPLPADEEAEIPEEWEMLEDMELMEDLEMLESLTPEQWAVYEKEAN